MTWLCISLWLVRVTGEIAVMLATAWLLLSWVPSRGLRRGTRRGTMVGWPGRPATERRQQ